MMKWIFPSSIILILTSKFLFPIVFNPDFVESSLIFNIYLLIIITRFLFTRIVLIGLKNTKPIFWSSLWEIVINVVLSVIFIQFWGIAGVAIATVISYFFEKLYLVIYVKAKYGISPKEYLNVRQYSIWSVILIGAFFVSLLL
jgi:O-antigen/teichoic acid export membrane protein